MTLIGTTLVAAAILAALAIGLSRLAFTPEDVPRYVVSQKGRAFHPDIIHIHRGEAIRIVNDDGDLSHHAYVKTDKFSFDSGDQLPGSTTDVIFPVPGTFNVLCGIHPKMKLIVEVK